MPLAYGVSARATATFESLSWSTVPSRPAATNIRRSVLRWSIAMIEKIPSSLAMSARVLAVRSVVVVIRALLVIMNLCCCFSRPDEYVIDDMSQSKCDVTHDIRIDIDDKLQLPWPSFLPRAG